MYNNNSAKKVNKLKKEAIGKVFKNLDKNSKLVILNESERLRSKIEWLGVDGALELIATIGLYQSPNEKR